MIRPFVFVELLASNVLEEVTNVILDLPETFFNGVGAQAVRCFHQVATQQQEYAIPGNKQRKGRQQDIVVLQNK
jgi:hypothetical protein